MTTELSMAQFLNQRRPKSELSKWLLALPLETPTRIPDGLTVSPSLIHRSANNNGVRVKTRTIDGVLWVARVEK